MSLHKGGAIYVAFCALLALRVCDSDVDMDSQVCLFVCLSHIHPKTGKSPNEKEPSSVELGSLPQGFYSMSF